MKLAGPFCIVIAAALFAGCATQTKEQLAAVRAARVSPGLVQKLEHRGILTPNDLVELKRRRVDDGVAIRQLDRVGVDYILSKKDVKMLRDSGVSTAVINAALLAGERFAVRYFDPGPWYGYGFGYGYGYAYPGWYGPWGYPYRPYYYGPGWGYGGYRQVYPRRYWY
jgi:hypothetical protein